MHFGVCSEYARENIDNKSVIQSEIVHRGTADCPGRMGEGAELGNRVERKINAQGHPRVTMSLLCIHLSLSLSPVVSLFRERKRTAAFVRRESGDEIDI